MYERFTDRARYVIKLANKEARQSNRECIDAEQILLGLLREGSCVAAHVLKRLGMDLEETRRAVEDRLAPGTATASRHKLPQTRRAKKVIEYAMEEARSLGHNYVGTEHLLLGLSRLPEGFAIDLFAAEGLTADRVREETLEVLGCRGATIDPRQGQRVLPAPFRWLARLLRSLAHGRKRGDDDT